MKHAVGSKVRVKANPDSFAKGFTDNWVGLEGIITDDSADTSGAQPVKVTHDPHNLRTLGSVYRLINLELIEGPVDHDSAVEHPAHYGGDTVYEVIKVIRAWGLGFVLGNVVKYVARAGKKPGNSKLQDLKKARDYLNKEIEELEANND